MGWDAAVFGKLRVKPGFDLAIARKDALTGSGQDAVWPFQASVDRETAGGALARWGQLAAPEYTQLRASEAQLEITGYWSSGTLIEQGATLCAVLRALGARGATGTVHVVGLGEEHVFALGVSRKGVRIEGLDETAYRTLVTQAAARLERPNTAPRTAAPAVRAVPDDDAARFATLLRALEELPTKPFAGAVAECVAEAPDSEPYKALAALQTPRDLGPMTARVFAQDAVNQRVMLGLMMRVVAAVLRHHAPSQGLQTAARELLTSARDTEMRVAGAAVLAAIETDASVDALFSALEASGATVGNAGHRSFVREQAVRSLSGQTRADISPRALALLTTERLQIAKQKSMATWGVAPLEDQVHFVTEVMTILARRRYAPASPLLWKLSSARHDRVSSAARHALLAVIDDALLKRIFGMTRKAFEAKYLLLGTMPRQTIETLFTKALPTFERLWPARK